MFQTFDRPHRKTCVRFNDPGHAHALTFSCYHRRAFLDNDRSRQLFLNGLDLARTRHRFHLWAYVVMAEHAHVLVWPTEQEYSISKFLATLKQSVFRRAYAHAVKCKPEVLALMEDRQPCGREHFRFWQPGGGYDRNLVGADAIHAHVDYFHMNPVRRGLVTKPEDWYWSSAADYAGLRQAPIRIDQESLPPLAVFEHRRKSNGPFALRYDSK